MIVKSLLAVRRKLDSNRRKYSFELFGYDFILDVDQNVFLIEVNTNPCLEESSALLKQLLPRMVDDMIKLTVDKVFPKPKVQRIASRSKKRQVGKSPLSPKRIPEMPIVGEVGENEEKTAEEIEIELVLMASS